MSVIFVFLSLGLGLACGRLWLYGSCTAWIISIVLRCSLVAMLCFMGISLGQRADLWHTLQRVGGVALLFALASGFGSVLFVRFLYRQA